MCAQKKYVRNVPIQMVNAYTVPYILSLHLECGRKPFPDIIDTLTSYIAMYAFSCELVGGASCADCAIEFEQLLIAGE